MYIRSLLEQNVAVWHHSLTVDNSEELERVQKVALKIIWKENYLDYPKALKETNLQSLKERRKILCLRFAKGCVKNPKTSHMFPLNENFNPKLRVSKKYAEKFARTDRLRFSAIPALQRMLNEEEKSKKKKTSTDLAETYLV